MLKLICLNPLDFGADLISARGYKLFGGPGLNPLDFGADLISSDRWTSDYADAVLIPSTSGLI